MPACSKRADIGTAAIADKTHGISKKILAIAIREGEIDVFGIVELDLLFEYLEGVW